MYRRRIPAQTLKSDVTAQKRNNTALDNSNAVLFVVVLSTSDIDETLRVISVVQQAFSSPMATTSSPTGRNKTKPPAEIARTASNGKAIMLSIHAITFAAPHATLNESLIIPHSSHPDTIIVAISISISASYLTNCLDTPCHFSAPYPY